MALPRLTTRARQLRIGDLMVIVAIAALPFAAMGLLMRAEGPELERSLAVDLMVIILVMMLAAWFAAGWQPRRALAWLAGSIPALVILMSLGALSLLIGLFSIHAIAATLTVATIVALAFYLTSWD